jgi:hypothetical protein
LRRSVIIAALVLGLGLPGTARGQADERVPDGRFGMIFGVRQGLGQLGTDFGIGVVGGIEAGYHPRSAERRLSLGLHWSMSWSWFGYDDIASVAGSLHMIELGAGGRLRVVIDPAAPRFLTLGAGANLLRTNVPLPGCEDRRCLGPYVSLGTEHFVFDAMLLGIEARYNVLPGGPGSIAIMLGVSFGT